MGCTRLPPSLADEIYRLGCYAISRDRSGSQLRARHTSTYICCLLPRSRRGPHRVKAVNWELMTPHSIFALPEPPPALAYAQPSRWFQQRTALHQYAFSDLLD